MKLWQQIAIAMVLGVVVGLFLGKQAAVLHPLGLLFLNLVKMLVGPLLFAGIVTAIVSALDEKALGRAGVRFIGATAVSAIVASLVAIVVMGLLGPGKGVTLALESTATPSATLSFGGMLASLAPESVVRAFAENQVIQIIVASMLFGIAIRLTGEKGKPMADLAVSLSEVMAKLTGMVMRVSPIGVFALMAWMAGTQESKVLWAMLRLIGCFYLSAILFYLLVYGVLLSWVGVSLKAFFLKTLDVLVFAASTTSSAATLPVTLKAAEEKLGVRSEISRLVLPLGVSINMHGTILNMTAATLFVAQVMEAQLGIADYAMLVVIGLIATFGTAGVPASGIVMITLALSTLHLNLGAIGLLIGIYRLLDMVITPLNVLGDIVIALWIDRKSASKNL